MGILLRLSNVSKTFSGLTALSGVSFDVKKGQIKGLIGPNGAGKTTIFNLISGVFPPSDGRITFSDRDITRLKPEKVARLGLSRTFQRPHLFKNLTALENVMLGLHHRTRAEFFACGLNLPHARSEEIWIYEQSLEYLRMLGLANKKESLATELPLSEQRCLEVARALATEPKMILLDEPTAGLGLIEARKFQDILFMIREKGITLLIIEHHMKFIMDVCDEITVLNFGAKIAEGTPKEIQNHPQVIEAYLGAEG